MKKPVTLTLPLLILAACILLQCGSISNIRKTNFSPGNLIPFAAYNIEGETKWGYLDEDTGEIVIEAKYRFVYPFVGNFAIVQRDRDIGSVIIDKNEKVIRTGNFDEAYIITSESGRSAVAILIKEKERKRFLINPLEVFVAILLGESLIQTEEYQKERMVNLVTGRTLVRGDDLYLNQNLQTAGDYFFVDYTVEKGYDDYRSYFHLYKFLDNGGTELVVKDDIPRAAEILKEYLGNRGINAVVNVNVPGRIHDLEIDYGPYIREIFYPVPDIKLPLEIKNDPGWNMVFDKAEPFYRDHTLLLNTPLEINERKYLVYFNRRTVIGNSIGVYNATKDEWEVPPILYLFMADTQKNTIFYPIRIRHTNNPNLYSIEVINDEIGWSYGRSAQIDSGIYNIVTKTFSQDLYLYEGYPPSSGTILMMPSSGRRLINFPNKGVYYRDYSRIKNSPFSHSSRVYSVKFSPDGRTVASGSSDGKIKLWDVETGNLLRTIDTDSSTKALAFSPDGEILVSSADSGRIQIRNAATGGLIRSIQAHSDTIYSLALSQDGRITASGSGDRTIKLWDTETGELLRTLRGHTKDVNALAFSPDGMTLASGSDYDDNTTEGLFKLWDTASGSLIRNIRGHPSSVYAAAFSPDGRMIATGSVDNRVRLFDAANGRLLKTFYGHTEPVSSVVFSPDSKTIVSGSWDKKIILHDAASGKQIKIIQGYSSEIWSVDFSPDGRTFVSGGDKNVKLWDASSGEHIRTFIGNN
jgi:WD40 repeat protein